jgi:hypothetical protein
MMRIAGQVRRGNTPATSKNNESIGLNKTEIKPRHVKRFLLGGQA